MRTRTDFQARHWEAISRQIDANGYALVPSVLTAAECRTLIRLYDDDSRFRKRVDMGRHAFGEGDYAYFSDPLPSLVQSLRTRVYAGLAPLANRMMERLGRSERYPATLEAYRKICHRAGQTNPTPLLLRYRAGGYNRLHRDLYGELRFPLQATVLLSQPGADFEGGEFLLVENRPREQAIGTAVALRRGQMIVFPVHERPAAGKRSSLRVEVRHGVSRILRGERFALGIIFHDAA
jgi:hypothetical protein